MPISSSGHSREFSAYMVRGPRAPPTPEGWSWSPPSVGLRVGSVGHCCAVRQPASHPGSHPVIHLHGASASQAASLSPLQPAPTVFTQLANHSASHQPSCHPTNEPTNQPTGKPTNHAANLKSLCFCPKVEAFQPKSRGFPAKVEAFGPKVEVSVLACLQNKY